MTALAARTRSTTPVRPGTALGDARVSMVGRMRILLLSPPGGGKGTQGARLSERLGVPHVAAGDLLRREVASGSPAGERAAAYVRRGELVPDELIIDVLEPALAEAAARGGFILDGFPRTVEQAHAADEMTRRLDAPLEAVVYLDVPEDELERRLLARAGIEGRSDDTPAVIARRFRVFEQETEPLIDFYAQRGILLRADGRQDVEGITEEVLEQLARAGLPAVQPRRGQFTSTARERLE